MVKGTILISIILILIVSGCTQIIEEEGSGKLEATECVVDETIEGMICELSKAGNSVPAQIRIKGKISNYYNNNTAQVDDLMEIILNKNYDDSIRTYFMGLMRSKSTHGLEGNIADYDKELAEVLLDKDESYLIKLELGREVPMALLYREKDAPQLYAASEELLNQNDTLASLGVGIISGAFANIDMNRSTDSIIQFAENYKKNYKERPQTTIYVLSIIQAMEMKGFEEEMTEVCKGFEVQEMSDRRRLCYKHLIE